MRTFVQVNVDPANPARSYVHWKFEAEGNPYPPMVDVRDVTDANPMPGEGWTANSDGTYSAPPPPQIPPAPPPPTPNNPGNPYFGKKPKIRKDFWGLVLQVYVAMQGSYGAGLDRMSRLLESKRAQPILKVADSVDTVDPDDKEGAFLRMVGILTGTNHETDGTLLMEKAELAAVMAAWE